MKLGVISDIHANLHALEAALALLAAEQVDELIVLGDLLSYGCHPREVLKLMHDLPRQRPTTVLVGNHDQLYFEMQAGRAGYFDRMPLWIQESATWTLAALGSERLEGALSWHEEHVVGDTLFAHANPFGARDWCYLNGNDDRRRAASALQDRGFARGVFGHTHRAVDVDIDGVRLLNPGSVGQPRDGTGDATVGMWSEQDFRTLPVTYDTSAHLAGILDSTLSRATQAEILKYHQGARP